MSVEELKKTLENRPQYIRNYSKYWTKERCNTLLNANLDWFEAFESKFAEFLRVYMGELHIPRQQLEEHTQIICRMNPSWNLCRWCFIKDRPHCKTGRTLFGEAFSQKGSVEGSNKT